MNLFSRRIVGRITSGRMKTEFVLGTLAPALPDSHFQGVQGQVRVQARGGLPTHAIRREQTSVTKAK